MNREIKFRLWDKEYKQLDYASDLSELVRLDGRVMSFNNIGLDDVTEKVILMQYTGLTDKSGTEIYEGDIVRNENAKWEGEVIFLAGSFKISAHIVWNLSGNRTSQLNVVGNIYESKVE